jgi:hypothetical protein
MHKPIWIKPLHSIDHQQTKLLDVNYKLALSVGSSLSRVARPSTHRGKVKPNLADLLTDEMPLTKC